jgi:uncharacterized protein
MHFALLLPWLLLAAAPPDCGSTHDVAERLICADPALGAQQSKQQELYAKALDVLPAAERSVQQDREAAWRHERTGCASAQDPHRCLSEQLGRRCAELQITLKQVPVFAAVTYRCGGPRVTRLFASYYRTEPAAVRLRYHDQEAFAFVAAAASGGRYRGEDVQIWEHQGVARFTWHGRQMSCPKQ